MVKNNRSRKLIDKKKLKFRSKRTAKCHPKISQDLRRISETERREINSCLDHNDIQKLIGEWNRFNKSKIQYRKKDITGSLLRFTIKWKIATTIFAF